jgi:AhpD family alkylhydroperoxidase
MTRPAPLPTPDRASLPEELHGIWDFHERHGGVPNMMRTLFNNEGIAKGYFALVMGIIKSSGLCPRDRERLILAVARAEDCPYVWQQHVRIGRDVGLTDEEIDREASTERAIPQDWVSPNLNEMPEKERHAHILGVHVAAEFYRMTCRIIKTLDVQMETPFRGWNA